MLSKTFLYITSQSAKARRAAFRFLFEYLARRSQNLSGWTHMNYGYAAGPAYGNTLTLNPSDEPERYCHQLYHAVLGGQDLHGKDIVEISCGRGGGATFVARYSGSRTLTAVDIAPSAIAFCRRVHRRSGLRFVQGDAEDIPVFDDSTDAVLNVEASFCYGDFNRFLAEVHRVLRPGGHFFYADLRLSQELGDWMADLRNCGLEILDQEDITANVVRALELDHERRANGIRAHAPWFMRGPLQTFSGTLGTRIPTMLASGEMHYFRFVLRKPAFAGIQPAVIEPRAEASFPHAIGSRVAA